MLTPKHSELFDIPFYQFSQLKKYQPESIPQSKPTTRRRGRIGRP